MDRTRAQRPAARLSAGPPLLLDGATGTELERLGCRSELPLWSTHALIEDPAAVEGIHRRYAEAGAEILTANTFRTQRRALARAGIAERAEELTALAVELARRAAREAHERSVGRRVFVAGSAPTLEDCYRPDRVPADAELAAEHAEHARNLARAGVDLILAETMNTLREARAALAAARGAGVPAIVSFACDGRARLLSGECLEDALAAVARGGPLALGVNCLPPSAVPACLPVLAGRGLPFGVYANLGAPDDAGGLTRSEPHSPAEFADEARRWIAAGARLVGGCCGTGPEHIRALAEMLAA